MHTIFAKISSWFADATNGITDFFARRVHTQEICTKKSDGTEVCASGDQLAAILAGSALTGQAAAGTSTVGSGAPGGSSAQEVANADTPTTTTPNNDNEPPTIKDASLFCTAARQIDLHQSRVFLATYIATMSPAERHFAIIE